MKLVGLCRLGRDAEVKYTQIGDPVANFSAAFDFGQKGQDGKRQTQWVTLALFGARAEKLAEWLTKGRRLFVWASDVHVRVYDKKGGGQGAELRARVDDLEFADSKEGSAPASTPEEQQTPASGIAGLDDDIPF